MAVQGAVYCEGTTHVRRQDVIVSVTEVQSFKRCRRQWDYGSFNRQGLTPIIQPKPYLDLGTMVHKSLAYWTEKPDADLAMVFMQVASAHKNESISKYVAATGREPQDSELEPLIDAIVLGQSMMRNYQQFYGQPLPPHLTFCKPEQEIIIPIPGTEHPCEDCHGSGERTFMDVPSPCNTCEESGTARHYLKARLDALAADRRGNIYVVERKTYEKRPDLYLLEVSDQFIGYVWAAQQMDIGTVIGLAYDGMWKRANPPQRPRKMTLEDLFVRTIISPAQDEVNEYGAELARVVMDMANSPYVYKNRQWQGCWDCSFERLCRAQSQDNDVEYMLRTEFMRRTEDDVADIVQQVETSPLG